MRDSARSISHVWTYVFSSNNLFGACSMFDSCYGTFHTPNKEKLFMSIAIKKKYIMEAFYHHTISLTKS